MKQSNLQTSTAKALTYLAAHQNSDGGFSSMSSLTLQPFEGHHTYRTTFVPALMLAALSNCAEAMHIRTGLAKFLLSQKSNRWSFNYWANDSFEATAMPYPDDLDDTFCAASALWLHDAALVDETALARLVKLLIAAESQPGGPYRTWVVPSDAPAKWHDIDLAINANIAYFLSLAARPLPTLTHYMEQCIKKQRLRSPYYPSTYPICYYLARAYLGPAQKQLAMYLLQQQTASGHWQTPLQTALAMSALVRLGHAELGDAAQFLLATQNENGSWNAEAICRDPMRERQTHYGGSTALTTTLAIEALHLWQKNAGRTPQPVRGRPLREPPLYTHISDQAQQELSRLPRDLHQTSLAALRFAVDGKNGKEILLLPYQFYKSLPSPPPLPERLFIDLGLANLYGWMAYTIYDDFLDNEGDPRQLSAANVAMRRSLQAFAQALPGNTAFLQVVNRTFDTIDAANAWEVAHCRFKVSASSITIGSLPRYGARTRLADRSLGHALTPLVILAATGTPPQSPAAQALLRALRHYIIARQLNDDTHDWRADLQAGRITYVVGTLLSELHLGFRQEQHFDNLLPHAERQFWHTTLPRICEVITRHSQRSRQELIKSNLLLPQNVLTQLLDGIDTTVATTLANVQQAENFLKSFIGR